MNIFKICFVVAFICSSAAAYNSNEDLSDEDDESFYLPNIYQHRQHRIRQQISKRLQDSIHIAGNNRIYPDEDTLSDSQAFLDTISAIERNAAEQPNLLDNDFVSQSVDELASHGSRPGHQVQYVSGGAGEGQQMIGPHGNMENKEEVKSDEDLPAYCDPPNPCPVGYAGEDCDSSKPFEEYTAEYSKSYQEQQNCMCDDDHNECAKQRRASSVKSSDKETEAIKRFSAVVAKKSPIMKRDVGGAQNQHNKKNNKTHNHNGNGLKYKVLKMHVAKKSI